MTKWTRRLKLIGLAVIVAGASHANAATRSPDWHATITPHPCTFTVKVTNRTFQVGTITTKVSGGPTHTYTAPQGTSSKNYDLVNHAATVTVSGPVGQLAKRKVLKSKCGIG